MSETEGVVKYQLDYNSAPPVSLDTIKEINAWRKIFFMLDLIGQDPARYGGYGYGNVSCRLKHNKEAFLITGTQTGHLPSLGPEHYTTVTMCDPDHNHIVASGPVKPSSEALTHGALYRADKNIQYVFHVHCPEIWNNAAIMGLTITDANIQYGTPEMAQEFERLVYIKEVQQRPIIVMGGHEDGVVTYGASAEHAGSLLVNYFNQSLQIIL